MNGVPKDDKDVAYWAGSIDARLKTIETLISKVQHDLGVKCPAAAFRIDQLEHEFDLIKAKVAGITGAIAIAVPVIARYFL